MNFHRGKNRGDDGGVGGGNSDLVVISFWLISFEQKWNTMENGERFPWAVVCNSKRVLHNNKGKCVRIQTHGTQAHHIASEQSLWLA